MNCMACDGLGLKGGWLFVGVPITHNTYDLSLARHLHDVVVHVHWSTWV